MEKNEQFILFFGIALLFAIITGCEMNTRGVKVFQNSQCNECHIIKGKGGAAGPNLTAVGKRRSREYIIEQIRNPGSLNAETNMPSFPHLSEQDLNDLVDYLSGLK